MARILDHGENSDVLRGGPFDEDISGVEVRVNLVFKGKYAVAISNMARHEEISKPLWVRLMIEEMLKDRELV